MHLLSVFSLRNRALIALVTIVVAVFGGISLTLFKQELIPSLSLPSVYIVTSYPGASPDVVSKDVSDRFVIDDLQVYPDQATAGTQMPRLDMTGTGAPTATSRGTRS